MKKINVLLAGVLLVLAGCSKTSETDFRAVSPVVHPGGMSFEAGLGSMTKTYFGDAANPGQLYWEETDKVAIYGVPITGTKDSGWDHYIFDWTNMVSDLATVEVNSSDPSKATFHTSKNADQWLGSSTQMMFFAIYPATEIPQIVRDEERDETNFLLTIPRDQDGVHFGNYQIMCSTTLMYESSDIASGTTASFRPFSPGGCVLAFNVKNATSAPLEISKIKIINQNGELTSYPEPLTGAQSLYIDYSGNGPDEGPEAECGSDFDREVYFDVNLNLDTPLTLASGETSGKLFAAVGHVYMDIAEAYSDSDLATAYFRVEALDGNDNVLASAERGFPNNLDERSAGFEQGLRYDFTIDLEEETGYHFVVVQQPGVYRGTEETRNSDSGLIRSYKVVDGVSTYVDWTVDAVFNDLAGTQALDIEDVLKLSDTGIDTKEFDIVNHPTSAVAFTIGQRQNRNKMVATSRSYTPSWYGSVGSVDSYYNLSNPSNPYGSMDIQNTANCYVVNAPGYYTFPCVLGNGIKDGAANPGAWSASDISGDSGYIANLKDYVDGDVSSPYVHNSSAGAGTPTSACIIWEDVDGLIDADASYQLSAPEADGNGIFWIKFHIDESKISQGNAVLAVKDENGIVMWSWHIWVTPFRFGAGNNDNISIDIISSGTLESSPVNLGFVEQEYLESLIQEDDVIYVRLKQNESGKTVLVKSVSAGAEYYFGSQNIPSKGYSPLWQFGRKDPLMPGDPSTGSNLPVYGTATEFAVDVIAEGDVTQANVPFSRSIRHPERMIIADIDGDHYRYSYVYDMFNNLWNMTADFTSDNLWAKDISQRKSIYDPTPVGYQVPQPSDFSHYHAWEVPSYDVSKTFVRGWNEYGLFAAGQGRTNSVTFFPYTGGRYHRNGGAISPVYVKWPEDYTPINQVGFALSNNRENRIGTGMGLYYYTYSYSKSGDEYTYDINGDDYPLMFPDSAIGCADISGFVRPVADRSGAYTPSAPVFGENNGAGSYTDTDF